MHLLAGGDFNPVNKLFDQHEIYYHGAGSDLLLQINLAIGSLVEVPGGYAQAGGFIGLLLITKQVVWTLAMMLVVGTIVILAANSKPTAKGAPRGLRNFLEPVLVFIRDEVVRPNVKDPHHHHDHHGHGHDDHGHGHGGHGHDHKPTHKLADKLLPYFCGLFFFIAGCNVFGLIPGGTTPTSSLTVTGLLASMTLVVYVVGGMVVQNPLMFIKNLVPACPLPLWPLLFLIELVGLLVKPVALMLRLFANMTAGHCILLSLAFLGSSAVVALGGAGFAVAGITVLGSAAIYCLELFVALLQAYIFTYLSAIFIGSYLVPEH